MQRKIVCLSVGGEKGDKGVPLHLVLGPQHHSTVAPGRCRPRLCSNAQLQRRVELLASGGSIVLSLIRAARGDRSAATV